MERVFVTGLGGEIGTRVARRLEALAEVDAICGVDLEPPRRRLQRTEFHLVRPGDADGLVSLVHEFAPTAVVHFGIYEPNARSTPGEAVQRTAALTDALMGAVIGVRTVQRIVVRSGLEVYGRGGGRADVPDETAPRDPTSGFGRIVAAAEAECEKVAGRMGAPLAILRFAPIAGAHMPSPLARYLRLPVVPVTLRRPLFQLVHLDDVARATESALLRGFDGPVNIAAADAVDPWYATWSARRLPVPLPAAGLLLTRSVTEIVGSPLPDHVRELLRRGRRATTAHATSHLGFTARYSTREIVADLHAWESRDHVSAP
ncbi:MAG: NAD-dependent epimerase/dehydratase family protein [Acidimicrobiales bacterium]